MKSKSSDPFFTVFTPTYNREDLLKRVHQCLVQQTYRDFEWLIVDDGSNDRTRELVTEWETQSDFPVRYFYQENGGKHTAVNTGVRLASGVLMVEVDSDDWLLSDALKILHQEWQSIRDDDSLFGVTGLFQYEDGSIVGDKYPEDHFVSNPIDLRYRHHVRGDKLGANRIDVLREFDFPEEQRQFIPESFIWNRIAQQYDTLFINRPIGVKEYQETGLTVGANLNSVRCSEIYYCLNKELLSGNRSLPVSATIRCLISGLKCAVYSKSSLVISNRHRHLLLSFFLLPMVGGVIFRDFVRLTRLRLLRRKDHFLSQVE